MFQNLEPLAALFACLCLPNIITAAVVWYFATYAVSIRIARRELNGETKNSRLALDKSARE